LSKNLKNYQKSVKINITPCSTHPDKKTERRDAIEKGNKVPVKGEARPPRGTLNEVRKVLMPHLSLTSLVP